jgi:probable F420-dependent oxidoreductase
MTETSTKPDLGRFGVWSGPVTPDEAVEMEKMGYGAVWAGGSPDADLSFVEPILDATESLQIATGIVNIWKSPAGQVAESFHRIEDAYPGRFLLGVGVGHPEAVDRYRKPYDALVEYLDELDAAAVPTSRRVIAALGPRVLQLSKDRSAGAHPYLTTPEHTAEARQEIGPTTFLAPEHKVVLTTDTDHAREIGRQTVGFYLGLSNYVNNWRRLGFGDADFSGGGSDRLIDANVAWGDEGAIRGHIQKHWDAGADHVCIQAINTDSSRKLTDEKIFDLLAPG